MTVFILDNYDSFTYNLVHLVEPYATRVEVVRNDAVDLDAVAAYDRILISPGPGLPKDAGALMAVLERYSSSKPVLGVCLGLQAIVEHFGGSLKQLDRVLHGTATRIHVRQQTSLFAGLPTEFQIGHYHSWIADANCLPDTLEVTATDEAANIMAVSHKTLPVYGVQFHPESILTEYGSNLIQNFLASGAVSGER